MALLRCVIDSNVFDAIARDPDTCATVGRLTDAGQLELLAAPVTIAEVAATPDRAHRCQLQRVRVLVVPPVGDGFTVTARRLRASNGVSDDDVLIALTAASNDVPLVTEDRDLREAVATHLRRVPLWRWATDLRPRIDALAAGYPPLPHQLRRRR